MSIERVREYFRERGMEDRIREFDVSSATVELAAQALHTQPARIAKSMAFLVNGKPVLVIAPGDVKIDNTRFKKQFQTKAKMIPPEDLPKLVGHPMGGVCPFAVNDGVRVFLDTSLRRFRTVFPACGSANSAIELTVRELMDLTGVDTFVDVCKAKEEE